MARRKEGGGRITRPDAPSAGGARAAAGHPSASTDIPPLYKRRPGMFAFMVIACAAMVLSMMGGIFTVL
ncbi:MAG: hypothetical protein R2733_15835 [Acidimicrobiales bacterium]